MGIVNLPLLPLIIFNIALGVFVLFQNKKSLVNQSFSAFIFSTSFWMLSNFFIDNLKDPFWLILWTKIAFASSVFVALFFYYFALSFRGTLTYPLKALFLLRTSFVALSVVVISFTNLVVQNVTLENNLANVITGPAHTFYIIIFLGYILLTFYHLFKSYRQGNPLKKLQLKYFMLGTLVTIVFVSIVNFIIPAILGTWALTTYTPYFTSIMFVSISYAIVRHRLLDIEVIIRRSLVYSTLLAILIGMYSLLVFGLNRVFLPGATSSFPRVTDIIAIIVVAFTVDPLRRVIENATDKVFFKGRYNAEETINRLSESLVSDIDLTHLVKEIKKVLTESLKVSRLSIYIKSTSEFFPTAIVNDFPKNLDAAIEKKHFITKYLDTHHEILILEEIERAVKEGNRLDPHLTEAVKSLGAIGVEIVVPLVVKGNLSGAMFLGEKRSQDIYSGADIRFLEILSHQAALSLENAKLYEEQKLYGVRLTKEVERATGDLRHANEKLKELDELKDEFMSIASHELRTPMTAIKSYVWLALHGKVQEKDPKVRTYLDRVFESSDRMIAMINDMLNVSRIETGRMKLDIVPVSVWKMAEQVKDDLKAKSAEAGVEVIIKKDTLAPLVMSDKDKLAEIFTNLIGNALKFTKKGGNVTVYAEKEGHMVNVNVTDTGVGIARENIDKLFKKYGKLNESYALTAPSTGTGLGLYITKQYLEKMGGAIGVQSTFGKGTTFTFSLPIATGKDLEKHEKPEEQPQGVILNPKLAKNLSIKKAVVKTEIGRILKR
ncbi:MAG: hypothetical protein A2Z11_04805 [Candidatus Woykebacteria bacterium RBG_16_43_9]|uniref:histidine kinase n=1 Tax=Candidatus Woykebacteria bacterium RBG_16_43_9 TaxID=1802596 RepID=A0A1G1WCB9_9BACT|nr:MAG: hypothetical protein A2Z11_04805 [Candidatus Woykebacteria bacterium RBG_16_43_9]